MHVDYPHIPLIRINAPEVFADPDFKQWFFNRPKSCESAKYAPAIATWHQPQEAEFGEYSDFFTTIDGVADGDHAGGDGSESDMPAHIWKMLVTAAWEALDRPAHFECLLWVSNLSDDIVPAGAYQADIAGVMDCICRGLTDKNRGVAGASIQSSDNDNDSGEIFLDTPQGTFIIRIAC